MYDEVLCHPLAGSVLYRPSHKLYTGVVVLQMLPTEKALHLIKDRPFPEALACSPMEHIGHTVVGGKDSAEFFCHEYHLSPFCLLRV
jgi:hypothetical protein